MNEIPSAHMMKTNFLSVLWSWAILYIVGLCWTFWLGWVVDELVGCL